MPHMCLVFKRLRILQFGNKRKVLPVDRREADRISYFPFILYYLNYVYLKKRKHELKNRL